MTLIGRTPIAPVTFRAFARQGAWCVTREGAFYGDFLTRAEALRCACFGARAVEARGGAARVLTGAGDAVVPHQDEKFTTNPQG